MSANIPECFFAGEAEYIAKHAWTYRARLAGWSYKDMNTAAAKGTLPASLVAIWIKSGITLEGITEEDFERFRQELLAKHKTALVGITRTSNVPPERIV